MASEKIILKMTLWTIHISNFGANLKPAGHAHRATSTHFDSTPSELARAPCKRMPKPREHARWRHQSRIAVGAACHNTILLNQIEIPETAYFMERWLVLVRNGFLTPRIGRDTNVHHHGGVAPLLSSESNTVFKSRTETSTVCAPKWCIGTSEKASQTGSDAERVNSLRPCHSQKCIFFPLLHVMLSNRNSINHYNINNNTNTMNKTTMASTVPEMLDVSNVVQNKDGKLVEWEGFKRNVFLWTDTRSMSHPQHVTLNMDTQLDRPTVSLTVGNVKPSPHPYGDKRHPRRRSTRLITSDCKPDSLSVMNNGLERTHDTQTLDNTNTWRVTFANESVATVLFSEVESECGNDTTQSDKFMSVLSDFTRNFGILRGTKDQLLKITSDCKDDGFKFSLAIIQQHVYFRRTTRHLLAMLVNEAGGNVSVLCSLEQPGGGFRYQGDGGIVDPGASRDAKQTKKGIIVNRVAIEYGWPWQLFYDPLDSQIVSPE
jgi:hypothetical protein